MSRTARVAAAVALVALAWAAGAAAAEDDGRPFYLRLGVGGGLNRDDVSAETLLTVNLRTRFWGEDRRVGQKPNPVGMLEFEASYWERDASEMITNDLAWRRPESDLTVGLNALLVQEERLVHFFFGVGLNLHKLDHVADPRTLGSISTVRYDDKVRPGGAVLFGVELPLGEHFGVWGTGRWDIIEGDSTVIDTAQSRIYGGIRFGF